MTHTCLETIKRSLSDEASAVHCSIQPCPNRQFEPQEVKRNLDVCTREERRWRGRERKSCKWIFPERASIRALSTRPSRLAYLLPAQCSEWPFVLEKMLRASQKWQCAVAPDGATAISREFRKEGRGHGGLLEIAGQYWVNENDNSCLYYAGYTRKRTHPYIYQREKNQWLRVIAFPPLRIFHCVLRNGRNVTFQHRLYLLLKRIPYIKREQNSIFFTDQNIFDSFPRALFLSSLPVDHSFPADHPFLPPALLRALNAISPGSY